jgi:hypothetical protein
MPSALGTSYSRLRNPRKEHFQPLNVCKPICTESLSNTFVAYHSFAHHSHNPTLLSCSLRVTYCNEKYDNRREILLN